MTANIDQQGHVVSDLSSRGNPNRKSNSTIVTKQKSTKHAPPTKDDSKSYLGTALKRIIDVTTLPPEEAEKLEKRRTYNRESASRTRERNKLLVMQLQEEVSSLVHEKEELVLQNAEMRTRILLLERENQTLRLGELERRQNAASLAMALGGRPLGMGMTGFPLTGAANFLTGLGRNGF